MTRRVEIGRVSAPRRTHPETTADRSTSSTPEGICHDVQDPTRPCRRRGRRWPVGIDPRSRPGPAPHRRTNRSIRRGTRWRERSRRPSRRSDGRTRRTRRGHHRHVVTTTDHPTRRRSRRKSHRHRAPFDRGGLQRFGWHHAPRHHIHHGPQTDLRSPSQHNAASRITHRCARIPDDARRVAPQVSDNANNGASPRTAHVRTRPRRTLRPRLEPPDGSNGCTNIGEHRPRPGAQSAGAPVEHVR